MVQMILHQQTEPDFERVVREEEATWVETLRAAAARSPPIFDITERDLSGFRQPTLEISMG